jgi:hypothetical protein
MNLNYTDKYNHKKEHIRHEHTHIIYKRKHHIQHTRTPREHVTTKARRESIPRT